jgi:hypothetical protein
MKLSTNKNEVPCLIYTAKWGVCPHCWQQKQSQLLKQSEETFNWKPKLRRRPPSAQWKTD